VLEGPSTEKNIGIQKYQERIGNSIPNPRHQNTP